jgi:hypothetical protein
MKEEGIWIYIISLQLYHHSLVDTDVSELTASTIRVEHSQYSIGLELQGTNTQNGQTQDFLHTDLRVTHSVTQVTLPSVWLTILLLG